MSRKYFSRPYGAALLVGLAGIAVSAAGSACSVVNSHESVVRVANVTFGQDEAGSAAGHEDPWGSQAVQVEVRRTRGKLHSSTFQVAGGLKQSGEVLRLASSRAFRSLGPAYLPPSKSGRFRYDVKVEYRNGKTKRVVTYADTPGTPKVLADVIRKMENMPAPTFPPGFPFTGGFPFS